MHKKRNRSHTSERLLLEEISALGEKANLAVRGLNITAVIKLIRCQLGMPQKVLAKKAKVPQSTISRVEQGKGEASVSTLKKILQELSCDLVIIPILKEPIEKIRRRQARKIAEQHVRYLKGTMSLEKQKPDSRLLEELIKEKEEELLRHSGKKLWEDVHEI